MTNEIISLEAVIRQSLDHACKSGWNSLKQNELATRVVRRIRPDWSDQEAQSAVDWVRCRTGGAQQAF